MPKVDVQVSVDVPGFDGRAGFVTTGDRAWFTRGNVGYAVPQAAWSKIVNGPRARARRPRQQGAEAEREPELAGSRTSSPRAPSRWTASR